MDCLDMYSDSDVQRVREASDILAVVQSAIGPMKRNGTSYSGLCPFHEEKTPSFKVNPERQMFYCFGCHTGGDVFRFVMNREKLEFPEAVKYLADIAGISLEEVGREGGDAHRGLVKKLKEINATASELFNSYLMFDKSAANAREYLQKRGFKNETLNEWQVGYAVDSWDNMLKALLARGYDKETIETAGLIIRSSVDTNFTRYYDRFRNRIMFPIRNARGEIVGFGGRTMESKDSPNYVKYLNSPETPIFQKGKTLFGLHKALKDSREKRTNDAVVVEGYTDALMAHQFGANNVVAAIGASLTEEHARELRKYFERVTLMFDADSAGIGASLKASPMLLNRNLIVRVASLPGKDLDELLIQDGKKALDKIVADAAAPYAFFLGQKLRECEEHGKELGADEKSALLAEVKEFVAGIRDTVQRKAHIADIARIIGLPYSIARESLEEKIEEEEPFARTREFRPIPAGRAEINAMAILLRMPDYRAVLKAELNTEHFTNPTFQGVFRYLCENHNGNLFDKPAPVVGPNLFRDMELKEGDIAGYCERNQIPINRTALQALISEVCDTDLEEFSIEGVLGCLKRAKLERDWLALQQRTFKLPLEERERTIRNMFNALSEEPSDKGQKL